MTAGQFLKQHPELVTKEVATALRARKLKSVEQLREAANFLSIPADARRFPRQLRLFLEQIRETIPRLLEVKVRGIILERRVRVETGNQDFVGVVSSIDTLGRIRIQGVRGAFSPTVVALE